MACSTFQVEWRRKQRTVGSEQTVDFSSCRSRVCCTNDVQLLGSIPRPRGPAGRPTTPPKHAEHARQNAQQAAPAAGVREHAERHAAALPRATDRRPCNGNSLENDARPSFQPELHAAHHESMEHRHKIRPVQLFVPSSSNPNALRLNKNALNAVLNHSSTANRKYSQKEFHSKTELEWLHEESLLEGFHWRSGAKRDTVGIWLWGEPILIDGANGERYAVVLMDTQGTFDPSASGYPASAAVFALSTLLSSVQCFNITDTINDETLMPFQFFTEYGKLAAAEAADLGTPFQHLYFIIRDFKTSEAHPDFGQEAGELFLDQMLRTNDQQPAETREIRELLTDCFENCSCFLLPHPGQKVAEAEFFPRAHIKPQFREEVKIMVQTLLSPRALVPKVVNGRDVTCKKLVEVIKEYAKIFDSHTFPQPRNVLNANVQLISTEYMQEAKNFYCKTMDRITRTSRMISEKKLQENHIKHGVKALNIYDRCPKIDSGDIRATNLSRLQESINRELEKYKQKNQEKRVTGCASALLACGDSPLLGLGLGGAASGAIAGAVLTLQMGVVSAGIVALPVSL
ncbi:GB1/RHD3-type G domain-containing protein [Aphelenchoides fujianensis]|nr:GB1/RHD3-type G domain-containing protein [Aphelenchoides fujianensis]